MSAYIKQLEALVERDRAAQNAAAEAARGVKLTAARVRIAPLDERLAKLLATIPVELQREGLSLPKLVPMLRGRWRATANAGQLGGAFRRLGWRRERRWRGSAAGFSALWYPPDKASGVSLSQALQRKIISSTERGSNILPS